ncbi:6259_t:CDS:1, partial [Dentiscutata erythropus]
KKIFNNNEDIVAYSSSSDKKLKKQKLFNTYTSSLELSQTEYDNPADNDNNNISD